MPASGLGAYLGVLLPWLTEAPRIRAAILSTLASVPLRALAIAMLIIAAPLLPLLALEALAIDGRLGIVMAHAGVRRLKVALVTVLIGEIVTRVHRIMHE